MKHTPSPWDYDYYPEHVAFCGKEMRPKKNPDYDFRIVFSAHVSEKEELADVHLIKAAPIMLEALKSVLKHLDHNVDTRGNYYLQEEIRRSMEKIRAAIAAAEPEHLKGE